MQSTQEAVSIRAGRFRKISGSDLPAIATREEAQRGPTSISLSLLVLVTAVFVALAACGDPDDRMAAMGGDPDAETFSGEPPGGTLVVLAEREPDELNPLTYTSLPANEVAHLIFRSLARRDSTLSNFRPDLARSWEVSEDGRILRLDLRDDVHWSDGEPVTAHDVVFTIERQRDPATASTRQADVAGVADVRALDDHTVEVEFAEPGPYEVNALLQVMPAPRHLLEDVEPSRLRGLPFGRTPVTNGMFRLIRWDAGSSITLAANPDQPPPRPALDRIVIRFVPDVTTGMSELLAGQADLLKLPADQRGRVAAEPRVELHTAARVRPAWLAWNVDREPVDDVRVRRAILMGIDREALVAGLFGEEGRMAPSPIPPELAEHSPEVEPIPFDPDGARALLEEAGWEVTDRGPIRRRDGEALRLEVDYIATDAVRRDVLVAVQAMLRRIGVDLTPRAYESTAWVDRLRSREFQGSFWGWGWAPGVAGTNAEMVFHSRSIPPAGPNFAGYHNPEVDELLDVVLREFDEEVAREAWRNIEQALIDDAVYGPLYLDPELYGVHQRFAGVRLWGVEWWEDVHEWHVPTNARLPRDRSR